MSSRTKKLLLLVAAAVAFAAVIFFVIKSRTKTPDAHAPAVLASAKGARAMRTSSSKNAAAPAAAASDPDLLKLPGTIIGRVIGPDGHVPEGVTVIVRREPQPKGSAPIQTFPAEVFKDGSFRADELPAGLDYVVQARTDSLISAENRGLEVEPSGVTDAGALMLTGGGGLSILVVDGSDQPVAGADVALRREENLDLVTEIFDRFEARATTGSDGRVKFSALAPGGKVVVAAAEGSPPTVLHNQAVAEGKELELTVKLAPGLALAGLVTNLEGVPIADAEVQATDTSRWFATSGNAKTDASGRFVIRGLPLKTHRVRATAKGYAPDERDRVAPGIMDLHLALEAAGGVQGTVKNTEGRDVESFSVRLFSLDRPGEASSGEDFKNGEFLVHEVPPGRYRLEATAEDLAPGGIAELVVRPGQVSGPHKVVLAAGESLEGVVTDVDGEVVEGARVTLVLGDASRGANRRVRMQRHDMGAQVPLARADTVSDASGVFHFSHVATGQQTTLIASHPLYPETRVVTEERHVKIVMEQPGQIAGQVLREGKGVIGQMVVMEGGSGMGRTTTAEDGRFVSGPLTPGRYRVGVMRGPEFREFDMPDDRSYQLLMVQAGKRSEVTFNLDPAPDTAEVICEVMNDAQPAAGITVRISRMQNGFFQGGCVTGADGTCSIPGVPTGEVTIGATIDSEQDRDRSVQRTEVIPQVQQHRIRLSIPQTKMGGVVFLASDGSPVAGARVTVNTIGEQNDGVGEGAFFTTQTDSLGRFTINHIPMGTYRVAAAKAGLARRILESVSIHGNTRSAETIRLDLAPGGWVDITVNDEAGKGLRGIAFDVETPEGEPVFVLSSIGTETTDASGRAYFDVLPAKPLVIKTYPKGGLEPLRWDVTLEAGKRIAITGVMKAIPGQERERE
jgi:hypothetical protein